MELMNNLQDSLIRKLGGYTADDVIEMKHQAVVDALMPLKYYMEENYGTNWTTEIYNKISDIILRLS